MAVPIKARRRQYSTTRRLRWLCLALAEPQPTWQLAGRDRRRAGKDRKPRRRRANQIAAKDFSRLTLSNNAAAIQNDQPIGRRDRFHLVRHDDSRLVRTELADLLADVGLGLSVQSTRAVVQ